MRAIGLVLAGLFVVQAASAGTTSYTGALASPEDSSNALTVTLATGGVLGVQTWGFGGGTNASDTVIPAGGFDPFVGVFAGTGSTATFIDGASDDLSNYSGSYVGCPPAGEVNIGGEVCGDVTLSEALSAGTYTVLITDAAYIPNAVFETDGELGDGFSDFTGGVLQTCNTVGSNTSCITPTADWALDITTPASASPVPEPNGLWALGLAFLGLGAACRRRFPQKQELPGKL
jgi:hypothetical protein